MGTPKQRIYDFERRMMRANGALHRETFVKKPRSTKKSTGKVRKEAAPDVLPESKAGEVSNASVPEALQGG